MRKVLLRAPGAVGAVAVARALTDGDPTAMTVPVTCSETLHT
jgi:hypothetical protein